MSWRIQRRPSGISGSSADRHRPRRNVAEQVQTLVAKGASLVELHDPVEALMTDPEGNKFKVVLDPNHEA
ncbi:MULTISPECIES: VOC family protein [Streptomyces]|uniref:VOC family protein n=1 Tax=Streptomyces TaxID=1883 RepID=UPI0023518ED4|nr:VOC family protein [Streptomyces sp. SID685]